MAYFYTVPYASYTCKSASSAEQAGTTWYSVDLYKFLSGRKSLTLIPKKEEDTKDSWPEVRFLWEIPKKGIPSIESFSTLITCIGHFSQRNVSGLGILWETEVIHLRSLRILELVTRSPPSMAARQFPFSVWLIEQLQIFSLWREKASAGRVGSTQAILVIMTEYWCWEAATVCEK